MTIDELVRKIKCDFKIELDQIWVKQYDKIVTAMGSAPVLRYELYANPRANFADLIVHIGNEGVIKNA